MRYQIIGWSDYQHYKDRAPPWIKLHHTLLTSEFWVMSDDASKLLAIASMLLAARDKACDGSFNGDPEYVKRFAYLGSNPNFKPLIEHGFISMLQDASNVLAPCITEKSREEKRTPYSPPKVDETFAEFWHAYPKKVGKGAAEKAWVKAKINGHSGEVLKALETQKHSEQWKREDGRFIPNPATWLNQRRWEDQIEPAGHGGDQNPWDGAI